MEYLRSFVRNVIKAPFLAFIFVASRLGRFTLYPKWRVPLKLEHYLGTYEKEATQFFRKNVRKGMCVADVGANVGYYTRIFSKLVGPEGKVYAFEPDTEALGYLKQNVAHLKNVTIVPFAVGSQEGTVDFFHIPHATSSHTTVPMEGAQVSSVRAVTLDSFIPEQIDIVKMDIEGGETAVFKGMPRQQKSVSSIVFEYTEGEGDALVAELERTGTVAGLTADGREVPRSEGVSYPSGRGGNRYANVVYRAR